MSRQLLAGAAVLVSVILWLVGQGGITALSVLLGTLVLLYLYPVRVVEVDPQGKAVFITG